MTTAYDESVIDFDLNFLNQGSNGTSVANKADQNKYEKQKRNISIMKKKIIATDALITKYYTKKQMLYDAEKNLAGTKEECKQICLDYRQALEKCSVLEAESQTIRTAYKTVEERCGQLENQCAAFQSHIHQLQQLIKEKDSTLESLRVEKKKTYVKEVDKKAVQTRDREKTSLNKDIKLFTDLVKKILGNRRLKGKYNELIRKYELSSDGNDSDTSDVFEEPFSPPSTHATKKSSNVATDSDCDYSVDTGRGSSVGSDKGKLLLSPDHFMDDPEPRTLVTIENRSKIKVSHVATSPIIFEEILAKPSLPLILDNAELEESINESINTKDQVSLVDRCLSPIRIKKRSVSTSPIDFGTFVRIDIENEFDFKDASTMTLQTVPLITIDRSSSPINVSKSVSVFTSPMKHFTREIATSPEIIKENIIQNESTQDKHEKECLELNNSNNIRRDNHADFEIEMILNTMQMTHDIITPIPRTPSKSRYTESRNVPSRVSSHPKLFEGGFLETVNEYSRVEELKMELDNLKSVLKQHILLTSKPLQFNHKPLLSKLLIDNDDLNEIEHTETNENTLSEDNSEMQQESNLEVSQSGLVLSPIDSDLLFGRSQSSTERDLHNMIQDNKERISSPRIYFESHLTNLEEKEITTEVNIQPTAEVKDDSNPETCEVVDEVLNDKVLDDTVLDDKVSDDTVLDDKMLDDKISDDTVLDDKVLDDTVLDGKMLDDKISDDTVLDDKVSDDKVLDDTVLDDKVSDEERVKDIEVKRRTKKKRLSKLDKLKEVLKPKHKIRSKTPTVFKSQLKSKPHNSTSKPIKFLNKRSLLSDLFGDSQDEQTFSDLVTNTTKGCKSPKSPNPIKDFLSTSESSSKEILKDNSQIDDETPPESMQLQKTQVSPSKAKIDLVSNDAQTRDSARSSEVPQSPTSQYATRSKSKSCFVVLSKSPIVLPTLETKNSEQIIEKQKVKVETVITSPQVSRKRRNNSGNESETQCKRILRSTTKSLSTENKEQSNATTNNKSMDIRSPTKPEIEAINDEDSMKPWKNTNHDVVLSYEDLDLFSDNVQSERVEQSEKVKQSENVKCQEKLPPKNNFPVYLKQSILCSMIDKYGVEKVRMHCKKPPETEVKMVSDKIEQYINYIIDITPAEANIVMDKFVTDLKKINHKHFVAGLMKYLTKSDRKMELFSKVVTAPAPPMTKAEQILIYVITHLETNWPSVNIVDAILTSIEYTLFKLNKTPDFGVVDSASHFYAILCRYFRAKSRLRLFILDAMYCTQFKSIKLIKQCLDVWMHIIPLAHMGIAKCPLVTCLVYLLHFYKCTDKENSIQVIRKILSERYFYKITDLNETKILDMFRTAIKELKDVPIERKMLRIALIILAKRQGPKWCQNQIIKNLLIPMIEQPNVPDNIKEFCVSMIGPLMKPYPADMNVNCEIVMHKLTDILNNEPSHAMEEAIIASMVFINRHNQTSVNKILLSREMKPFSPELEEILCQYVRATPLKVWERNISYLLRTHRYN